MLPYNRAYFFRKPPFDSINFVFFYSTQKIIMSNFTVLPWLRSLGVVGPCAVEAEVEVLQKEKDALEAELKAVNPQIEAMREAVAGPRERRAEATENLAKTFTPYLDLFNEKASQSQGVDAMGGVVEGHIKRVDQYNTERGAMYGYKAKYLHTAGVIMSQLCEKVNYGLPFPRDLHALAFISPAPTPSQSHERVLESMMSVSHKGAPTLEELQGSFEVLQNRLFHDGGEGVAGKKVESVLGVKGAEELKSTFQSASEKLEDQSVGAAIQMMEDVTDEVFWEGYWGGFVIVSDVNEKEWVRVW